MADKSEHSLRCKKVKHYVRLSYIYFGYPSSLLGVALTNRYNVVIFTGIIRYRGMLGI